MLELYSTINKRVKSVVTSHAHVHARTVHCAALTTDNVSGLSELPTKNLNSESLAFRLAAVLRTTYTFFMCHNALNF